MLVQKSERVEAALKFLTQIMYKPLAAMIAEVPHFSEGVPPKARITSARPSRTFSNKSC